MNFSSHSLGYIIHVILDPQKTLIYFCVSYICLSKSKIDVSREEATMIKPVCENEISGFDQNHI